MPCLTPLPCAVLLCWNLPSPPVTHANGLSSPFLIRTFWEYLKKIPLSANPLFTDVPPRDLANESHTKYCKRCEAAVVKLFLKEPAASVQKREEPHKSSSHMEIYGHFLTCATDKKAFVKVLDQLVGLFGRVLEEKASPP